MYLYIFTVVYNSEQNELLTKLELEYLNWLNSGQILAVGSDYPPHNFVDLVTVDNSTWSGMEEYPYGNEISRYAMVTFKDYFIVFGGLTQS